MPANTESGIEADTMTVFRQLPRNTRINSETRIDEMIASLNAAIAKHRDTQDPTGQIAEIHRVAILHKRAQPAT